MILQDKLKNHFQTIKSSSYSFKDLSSLLSSNRQEIAQAMIEMRTDNQLKFEIITEDTFRITEIDGEEFQFTSTNTSFSSTTNKGLFDRDGNIFVEPHELSTDMCGHLSGILGHWEASLGYAKVNGGYLDVGVIAIV